MFCLWEPFEDKFKCKNCGLVWSSDKFKSRCRALQDEQPQPPSLMQKAQNFTKAAVKHVLKGRKHCTEEQRQARYNQCATNQCGMFVIQKDGLKGVCAHRSCGCNLRDDGKFMDKLSWADSHCPLGYWLPIEEKDQETPENGV